MYWLPMLMVVTAGGARAQLTAQSSVAPDLRDCYMDPLLMNRNNLPPTTMPVLIDIIRKIEDNPNVNIDLRQLAALLLHTYRQDGIEFHQPETALSASSNVLPYAPTFHSFHRHRLLLTRIIPSNTQVLTNDTVSPQLRCALHYMLSTTVDARVRGDENNCNQLSQYRALRTARQVHSMSDDVEVLDPELLNQANRIGQVKQYNPKDDVEYSGYSGAMSERQLLGDSQCPLLGGVVKTTWGAVSAGNLIAGIAAGAESQQVPVMELVKGSALNYPNVQQYLTSIYPATLSGDLAEAALIQGTEKGFSSILVGATGGWNSTQAARYFMLQTRDNLEITDPEIRGDIDGFILGTTLSSILGTYSSIKLSQLLDMYYSPMNGVFNPSLRACNRKELSMTYIQDTTLAAETYAFAAALDTNMPLRGTITSGLDQLVTTSVNNFQTYVSSNMNDLSCVTTESTSRKYRLRTNLYIVLDTSWQYSAVYPAISYILDMIEVNKFGSSVTLLSAFDGSVGVNKTFSLADFHETYTLAKHQSMLTGVNLETTLTNIRGMMHSELNNETLINYVGGNSSVLLFLLNTHVQNTFQIWDQARILNETVPDLRILFASSTNQFDNLWNLVRDMHNDILTISLTTAGTNVDNSMAPVLDRIQQVARRIINPACGSTYTVDTFSGTKQFEDNVEPGYTNFYSISPNYFHINNDNRKIRIVRANSGAGSLVICHSRTVTQPSQNSTITGADANSVTCQTLAATGNVEISLQNACDGYWTVTSCPFFYVSVHSNVVNSATTSAACTDHTCRFPYNIKYQVQVEDLGCYNNATGVKASLLFVIAAFLMHLLRP